MANVGDIDGGFTTSFTDGVSGAGFSLGKGREKITQVYTDQASLPPYTLGDKYIYERADGSALALTLNRAGVKEELILNSKPAGNTISFDINLGTSTLRKEADGYHVISDAAEDLYTILNPNMVDAKGNSGAISMEVSGNRATLVMDEKIAIRRSSYAEEVARLQHEVVRALTRNLLYDPEKNLERKDHHQRGLRPASLVRRSPGPKQKIRNSKSPHPC